ncbi:MAG: hypothetical protein K0V04_24770 [Deltaproteobacteria bacterium]|nr:hypothetical protein [Deltaproteobacteria bacterium]
MTKESVSPRPPLAVLAFPESPVRHYEATIGTLVEAAVDSDPVVEFEGSDGEVVRRTAVSTVPVEADDMGHPVVLMFLRGDLDAPVITGRVAPGRVVSPKKITRTKTLKIEGRELTLDADSELTLQCGKASITLQRDGKIVLRGTNLVSRASSVNRIRGGTIQLN